MRKYLLLLMTGFVASAYAQSPGGVSGNELWLRAVPTGHDLQGTYRLADLSGDSLSVRVYNAGGADKGAEFTQSRSAALAFNFHPALSLSAGTSSKEILVRHSDLSQATVFGVFAPLPATPSADMVLYGLNGQAGTGTLLTRDKAVRATGIEPLDYGNEQGEDLLYTTSDDVTSDRFKETSPRIVTYLKSGSPGHSLWGTGNTSVITLGAAYSSSNNNFTTAFNTSQFGNTKFDGYTSEIIAYGRILTPSERLRVESYLALRHGLTLKGSYLDSQGDLIWDRDEFLPYHHRVTGIGRDDAGGLFQPMSTTSYEEAPNFSALAANDTYHEANSYSLPSSSRLLVIGREYGSPMADRSFTVWGDDGSPLTTYTSQADTLWHIMNRTWCVKTNTSSVPDSTLTRWTSNGLTVSSKGFLDDISQDNAAANAFAVTPSMQAGTGHIEFSCPSGHPAFEAGFCNSGENTCAYGFRINSDGSIRPIVAGTLSSTAVATEAGGHRLSLTLDGGFLYLRVDGQGSAARTVTVPASAFSGGMSGIIRTVSGNAPLVLQGVRTGGIGDTGCQAELSYNLTKNKEFANYSRRRTVLLIDPTGEGDFESEGLTSVRCSSPDIERGKTVFHNIFWDADGSGTDVFTFAYFDGIAVDVTPVRSSCVGGTAANDGAIDIDISMGTPVYTYRLETDSVVGKGKGTVVASGRFFGDSHRIEGLAPGVYTLSISQGGGNDVHGTGNALYTAYSHTTRRFTSGEVQWTVAETGSYYRIGAEPSVSEDVTQFGYDVRGDKAYYIIKGYTSLTQGVSIKPGDTLGLRFSGINVIYLHNGKEVHRETAWTLRLWRVCIKYGLEETHITDLTINGTPSDDFETSGNVFVETPKSDTATFTVSIGSECDATYENSAAKESRALEKAEASAVKDVQAGTGSSVLSVYPGDTPRTFTARLQQSKPAQASLMVFDAAGHLLTEKEMAADGTRFSVPAPGVYVVKAVTAEEEYTQKIMSK